MKIWIVHQYAIPPSRAGFTRTYDIARQLIELGHQVTLIASSFDHFARKEMRRNVKADSDLEVINGVSFLWIRTPAYSANSITRLWSMLVFCAKVWRGSAMEDLEKPDVIIGSSPSPFAALGAERLAARIRVPFVLEIRDLWPQTPIELGNYSKNNPIVVLMARIEAHLYKTAELIVTVLPYVASHIASKGGDQNKVIWIPNGVDFNSVPVAPSLKRGEVLKVIYAGSHGLANSLDTVVEAAKILEQSPQAPQVEITLYGDGPEKKRLMDFARDNNLQNIQFRDPVPKSQIWHILFGANACLIVFRDSPLYRWGVSPNKLFDYMAAARPVIFSISSPYNPVAISESGITVPAGDSVKLADAIIKLSMKTSAELEQMGSRGRMYVENNHNLRTLSAQFADALSKTIAGYTQVNNRRDTGN